MIIIQKKQIICISDWNAVVVKTYGRPYNFQQQDGCRERGTFNLFIPDECYDYENDSIPGEINGTEMGVSFAAWLARNPRECKGFNRSFLDMFWERNFYPNVQMIANDLHAKGLIPSGEYGIEIDW